VIIWTGWIWGP